MIITYSQMHRTHKNSQHSSIIWSIWLTGWVFVYKLKSCGFKSRFCHLNFRYHDCFMQGVPWHSDATMDYRFTLKRVRVRITTYSQNVYWLSRDKVITDYVNKYLACQANVFKQTPEAIHIYKLSEYLWR